MVGPRCSHSRPQVELRPGGVFYTRSECLTAAKMFGKWIYREIVAPERMVSSLRFAMRTKNPVQHPMDPNCRWKMLSSSTFTEHQGRTTLTSRHRDKCDRVRRKLSRQPKSRWTKASPERWITPEYLAKRNARKPYAKKLTLILMVQRHLEEAMNSTFRFQKFKES